MARTRFDEKDDRRREASDKKLGKTLQLWDHVFGSIFRGECEVQGLSLKRSTTSDEFLVVIRGLSEEDGTPMVAFHAAVTVADALAGAAQRVADGTVKWRVDEYRTKDST